MMAYAPTGTHATTRDNNGAAFNFVNEHGLFNTASDGQAGQKLPQAAAGILLHQLAVFDVPISTHLIVDFGYGATHGTVKKHLPAVQFALLVKQAELKQQFLGTTYRKCRYEQVTTISHSFSQYFFQLHHGVIK